MAALVQIKPSPVASFEEIISPSRPRLLPAPSVLVPEPRAFPEAATRPALPPTIRDEMLEHCAFTFCQGRLSPTGNDLRTIPACSRRTQTGRSAGDPRGSADILNNQQSRLRIVHEEKLDER